MCFVNTISQRSCGWFVDDAQDVKACNAASVLGCFSLGVGKISRASDDRLLHFVTEISLSVSLQLLQDECGDFLWSVGGFVHIGGPLGPHVSLHRNHGAVSVGDGLPLGGDTDQAFSAVLGEGDH